MARHIPVGVQLYSVREALDADQPAALARLAGLGFDLVETFGTGRAADPDPVSTARALRRDLDASGLTAVSAHAAAPIGDRAGAVVEAVNILGVSRWIISGPPQVPGFDNDTFTDLDTVRRFADALNESASVAADHGMRFGFHNHWREIERHPDGTRPYDVLVAALDGAVELEVDLYWTQAGGSAPASLIEQYRDRVTQLHLKDGPAPLERGQWQTPVGTGIVTITESIAAATRAEYGFLEIDQCQIDPFDLLAESVAWLSDRRP